MLANQCHLDQLRAVVDGLTSQDSARIVPAAELHELLYRFCHDVLLPKAKAAVQGADDIDKALLYTNVQIITLEKHRQYLLEERNLDPPILRFPTEVLSEIFRYLTIPPPRHEDAIGLLGFTQVCRRWRNIALCDSSLWVQPWLAHPKLAREMVSRAGGRPLHISIFDSHLPIEYSFSKVVAVAFCKPEHIQSLEIQLTTQPYCKMRDMLSSFPSGNAPLLESFNVHSSSPPDGSRHDNVPHPHVFAPRLQTLIIRDVVFPFEIPVLQSLRILKLVVRVGGPICRITVSTLLGILNVASRLEHLVLQNALVHPDASESSQANRITTQLRSLTLQHSAYTALYLLRHLHMPSLMSLRIEPNGKRRTLDMAQGQALFRELDRVVNTSSCCSLHHLHIDQSSQPELKLRLFSRKPQTSDLSDLAISVAVVLASDNELVPVIQSAQSLMSCLTNISKVTVINNHSKAIHGLWAALGSLPALTHICVQCGNMGDLIHALSSPITSPPQGCEQEYSVHQEEAFAHVVSISFRDWTEKQLDSLNALKTALVHRWRAGIPLHKVSFSSCKVPPLWIEELKGALPGVHIQG